MFQIDEDDGCVARDPKELYWFRAWGLSVEIDREALKQQRRTPMGAFHSFGCLCFLCLLAHLWSRNRKQR